MSIPHDPQLPLLADLLDREAARLLLDAALPETIAAVRITDVAYQPGRLITVRYSIEVAGAPAPVVITAMHGAGMPAGGVRVSDGAGEVALWRFPDDPGLPGLALVLDAGALTGMLAVLGIHDGVPVATLRAHRPGRRAVVEVRTPHHRLFVKVVRPKRVAELQGIHAALAPHVPIPRSLGWQPDLGVVFLDALPGIPLAAALVGGQVALVAGPDELIALLDLIAGCTVEARPRPGPLERAGDHAATLGLVVPEAAADLAEIVAALGAAPAEEPITAHRDFHASQLLIHDGRLRLVDVDTVGTGTRADDLAMLLAQAACLARPGPSQAAVEVYRRVATQRFEEVVDPSSLRLRTAAALLGFAIGPYRTQEGEWRHETLRRIAAARVLAQG